MASTGTWSAVFHIWASVLTLHRSFFAPSNVENDCSCLSPNCNNTLAPECRRLVPVPAREWEGKWPHH